MFIHRIKGIDLVSASLVSSHTKSLHLIREQQALLTDLLRYNRFSRLTENDLRASLLILQKASEKLETICEQLHKGLTPSPSCRRQKGAKKGVKK